jgi:hypothetical protein
MMTDRFVSKSCRGKKCYCGEPAEHKIGEVIQWDDPRQFRHLLTSYVCHRHFVKIMGPIAK